MAKPPELASLIGRYLDGASESVDIVLKEYGRFARGLEALFGALVMVGTTLEAGSTGGALHCND
jgi:hypothetical protein